MSSLPSPVAQLIETLSDLPGIGPKAAQRIVFFLLRKDHAHSRQLIQALENFSSRVSFCSRCFHLSNDGKLCTICADGKREANRICVVEDPFDVLALEESRMFQGLYHVLGGTLAPLESIGSDKLRIAELMKRLRTLAAKKTPDVEVIIAMNPSAQGEATALYLAKHIKDKIPQIRLTRLAYGIPRGSELEYLDEVTLADALKGRKEYGS